MRVVLPGRPEPRLQAVALGWWNGGHVLAYITGNAFVILNDATTVVQTIYDDDLATLKAIALDEASGIIAISNGRIVRLYQPVAQADGTTQVRRFRSNCPGEVC
jgi:hypothetical protein